MEWTVVKLETKEKERSVSEPYANISNGRIRLNVSASRLIENNEQYSYVEFLQGKKNGKSCVGIRFLKEEQKTENSLPIKRSYHKKKDALITGGINISSKSTLEKLFGLAATSNSPEKYKVALDEKDKTILVIYRD